MFKPCIWQMFTSAVNSHGHLGIVGSPLVMMLQSSRKGTPCQADECAQRGNTRNVLHREPLRRSTLEHLRLRRVYNKLTFQSPMCTRSGHVCGQYIKYDKNRYFRYQEFMRSGRLRTMQMRCM